jgi:hypothetical protein
MKRIFVFVVMLAIFTIGVAAAEFSDDKHIDAEHLDVEHLEVEHLDVRHLDARHPDANHQDVKHPNGFGIGINVTFEGYSEYYGIALGYGVTLKTPYLPIFIGAKFFFNFDYMDMVMTFTADYHILRMFFSENLRLGWYIGLGIDYQAYYKSTNFYYGIGLRLPIGLNFYTTEKIEFFLEVSPTVYYNKLGGKDIILAYTPTGLGIRFYF